MNLEQETRNGYFISAEMKKVWAVEMELLEKLLEVCNKHNLKIWAEGGTLLGAVREHGYIPWDDDIDMAMLREDYDKLIAISKKEFTSPYHFQSGHTEPKYPIGHAQLRKDGTTAILKGNEFFSFHQGIFIDIFVYDEIPEDENELANLKKKVSKMRSNLLRYCGNKYRFTHPLYSLKLFFFRMPIKIIGYHNYFKKMEDLLKSYKGKEVACMGFSLDITRFRRNVSAYNKTLFIPFEDIMIPIPSGYDSILTTQYGNYMIPSKAPTFHGGFVVIDTEKSFKEYIPLLRKKAKKEIIQLRKNKIKKIFGFQ